MQVFDNPFSDRLLNDADNHIGLRIDDHALVVDHRIGIGRIFRDRRQNDFLRDWFTDNHLTFDHDSLRRDRLLLNIPVFGNLINKSVIARWTRTLSTMFAAGVPLVEALDSVGGASGNAVYAEATTKIQRDVSTGSALTTSMQSTGVFPNMVIQMASIGEESGSLDHMLGKAAEFYEDEVDDMVKGLSSLMEPFIIVILGVLIGGIVVSMYLPIFKLGQVV